MDKKNWFVFAVSIAVLFGGLAGSSAQEVSPSRIDERDDDEEKKRERSGPRQQLDLEGLAPPLPDYKGSASKLHGIGIYERFDGAGGRPHEFHANVQVPDTITLWLSAYEGTRWLVQVGEQTTIERVFISGYHQQELVGPGDKQLPLHTYRFNDGQVYARGGFAKIVGKGDKRMLTPCKTRASCGASPIPIYLYMYEPDDSASFPSVYTWQKLGSKHEPPSCDKLSHANCFGKIERWLEKTERAASKKFPSDAKLVDAATLRAAEILFHGKIESFHGCYAMSSITLEGAKAMASAHDCDVSGGYELSAYHRGSETTAPKKK